MERFGQPHRRRDRRDHRRQRTGRRRLSVVSADLGRHPARAGRAHPGCERPRRTDTHPGPAAAPIGPRDVAEGLARRDASPPRGDGGLWPGDPPGWNRHRSAPAGGAPVPAPAPAGNDAASSECSRSTRFQNESTVNPRRTLSPPSPPAVGADPGWTGGGDGPPDRLPHECAWALTTAARRARHTDAVKGERLAWKVAWCARGVDREHAEAGYRRLRVEPYVATAPRHRAAGLDSSAVANRVLPAPSPQQ